MLGWSLTSATRWFAAHVQPLKCSSMARDKHQNVRMNLAFGTRGTIFFSVHGAEEPTRQRKKPIKEVHIENIPKTARMATCRPVTTAGTPKTSEVTGQTLMQTGAPSVVQCVGKIQFTAPRGTDTIYTLKKFGRRLIARK